MLFNLFHILSHLRLREALLETITPGGARVASSYKTPITVQPLKGETEGGKLVALKSLS